MIEATFFWKFISKCWNRKVVCIMGFCRFNTGFCAKTFLRKLWFFTTFSKGLSNFNKKIRSEGPDETYLRDFVTFQSSTSRAIQPAFSFATEHECKKSSEKLPWLEAEWRKKKFFWKFVLFINLPQMLQNPNFWEQDKTSNNFIIFVSRNFISSSIFQIGAHDILQRKLP